MRARGGGVLSKRFPWRGRPGGCLPAGLEGWCVKLVTGYTRLLLLYRGVLLV